MTVEPNSSSTPIARCQRELEELRLFVSLCREGLHIGTTATQSVEAMKRAAEVLRRPSLAPRTDAKEVAALEAFATSQHRLGFPYLYSVATIRLWSILEGLVDDVVSDRLRSRDAARLPALARIKGPLVEFMSASDDERIEILLEKLKESTDAPLKKGCGRFEALLDCVGLGGVVHEAPRRVLLELSEVRNAIIHRGGIADRRFTASCPWLGATDGQPISLTPDDYGRFTLATIWYLIEIDARIDTLAGKNVPPEQLSFQVELQQRLQAFDRDRSNPSP